MRTLRIVFVSLIACSLGWSQGASMMPRLKKTVAFIQLECKDGDKALDVRGTGFFVSYPDERLGKNRGFAYLVTNRHVAMCWDQNRRPLQVKSVAVRLNRKDGSSETIKLSANGNVHWALPSDDSVDLAAFDFEPDQGIYDFEVVPIDLLTTKDLLTAYEISEGEKIFFLGFFYQFPGITRIEPILRQGVLAMMPDEILQTTTGKPGAVYLGDVHVFGGNSGAPVFIDLDSWHAGRMVMGQKYVLLGVVSGMFYEDEELNLRVTTTVKGIGNANSGICMIVPAGAVRTLLDEPTLKAERDAVVATPNR
jgi:hypothetical protein